MDIISAFLVGFTAGIAATPHCLGMCGGFPLYLAKSTERDKAITHQVLFLIGKCFTYSFLGAIAGWFGIVLLESPGLKQFAPFLRIAIGLLAIIFGLSMLGLKLPEKWRIHLPADTGFLPAILKSIVTRNNNASAFILGLGVGLLPCPLPMGMLAVVASNHDVILGIVLMVGVGLGTMPGLLAVGLFGIGVNKKLARLGMQLAGVVVLAIGLLIFSRAAFALFNPDHSVHLAPCCTQEWTNK